MRHGAHSERELLSPGMRVLIRGQEWLVDKVEPNSLGNHAVSCTGISALVRDMTATFLDDLDTITPVDPVKTRFIPDLGKSCEVASVHRESVTCHCADRCEDSCRQQGCHGLPAVPARSGEEGARPTSSANSHR